MTDEAGSQNVDGVGNGGSGGRTGVGNAQHRRYAALETAQGAFKASKGHEPLAAAAYAQALYQIGDLDRAVQFQQDAVNAADPEMRRRLQGILDYYNLCKQLRTSIE